MTSIAASSRRLVDRMGRAPVAVALALAVLAGFAAGLAPSAGLELVVAVALVLIVWSSAIAGLCVFGVVIFLDLLPAAGVNAFSPTKLVGLLVALSCARAAAKRPSTLRDAGQSAPAFMAIALAFVAWAIASFGWAADVGLAASVVERLALDLLLAAIVLFAIREQRHAFAIATAVVVGTIFSAAYGILSGGFQTGDALTRLSGTVGDANELAAALVAAAPLAIAVGFSSRRRAVRVAGAAVAAAAVVGTLMTLSRGGLLALVVAALTAVLLAGRHRGRIALMAAVAVLGIVGYFEFIASHAALERVTHAGNGSGRSDLWLVARRMFDAHPIEGVGVGNFPAESASYLIRPGRTTRADLILGQDKIAHNTYLEILAELGSVGFVLFITLVGVSVASGVRARRRFRALGQANMELLALCTVVALVAQLAAIFFISEEYNKELWLLLALNAQLLGLAKRGAAPRPSQAPA